MRFSSLEAVRTWLLADTGSDEFLDPLAARWYEYLAAFFIAHIGAGLFADVAELLEFAKRLRRLVRRRTAVSAYQESRRAILALLDCLIDAIQGPPAAAAREDAKTRSPSTSTCEPRS